MRILLGLLLLLALAAAGAYVVAGRGPGPTIEIVRPTRTVGQKGVVEVTVQTPRGAVTSIETTLENNSKTLVLFTLDQPANATVTQETPERIRITRPFSREEFPDLQSGGARVTVTAVRPVLFGLRQRETTVTRDVQIRLEPPRVAPVSTYHYVNQGGSEMIVYRATPADVESGVRVGDVTYRGYPASGAGVAGADPSLKVAFFALLHDQDLNTPMRLFARDEAGNEATASFDFRVFPKRFRRSTIDLTDPFLDRVVPDILEHVQDARAGANGDDNLSVFVRINGELRRRNAETIAAFAEKSVPDILWQGAFVQLGNSAVESSFADHRTYLYKGQEVDQQVHLGFDLAVTAMVPIHASNRGRIVHADYLGIYGNCVIIDHGMGVGSLYGHLSSIDAKVGDIVDKGQTLGRSGMTGLAGGDHLHFTTLVGGRPVSPVDWWDPHWIEDRITRKLKQAAGQS